MPKKTSNAGAKTRPANQNTLTPVQIKAMDLLLSGMPLGEIAERIGKSRQTVSEWKNQHLAFKAKLAALRAEAEEELSFALPMNEAFMLGQLRRLAQDAPPEVRLKVIQYYFDRFGRSERDIDQNNPLLSDSSDMLRRFLGQHHAAEKA